VDGPNITARSQKTSFCKRTKLTYLGSLVEYGSRNNFARLVLHEMVHRAEVQELAGILEARMRIRVGGRMFFAAHMRRGDCKPSSCSMQA
jgi:hypothetical protein